MSDRFARDFPEMAVPVNHVEPVPRRIRALLGNQTVVDTTRALYVWESVNYPQYYIPLEDVAPGVIGTDGHTQPGPQGSIDVRALSSGGEHRANAARLVVDSPVQGLTGTVRFAWAAMDAWFEEDERVFVHPRNPYVRVDALRSTRHLVVELEGVLLADSSAPVMVFETGLPTRYYLDRTEIAFEHLIASDTVTECPYKGTTSGYWSVRVGDEIRRDLAWAYDFPTRQLLPIAGLVAFYNEKVDIVLDDVRLPRPSTPFS